MKFTLQICYFSFPKSSEMHPTNVIFFEVNALEWESIHPGARPDSTIIYMNFDINLEFSQA